MDKKEMVVLITLILGFVCLFGGMMTMSYLTDTNEKDAIKTLQTKGCTVVVMD